VHIPPREYLCKNVNKATYQRKKDEQPDPVGLPAFAYTMYYTNRLKANNNIVIVIIKRKHTDRKWLISNIKKKTAGSQ
jgi:hypothetical protein